MTTTSTQVPPVMELLVMSSEALYLGPCIMQAPGGWTRAGPTWYVRGDRLWICYGPGVASWGTTRGIAQLASADDCKPSWHDTGWVTAPDPNIVLPMLTIAIEASYMQPVRDCVEAVREKLL